MPLTQETLTLLAKYLTPGLIASQLNITPKEAEHLLNAIKSVAALSARQTERLLYTAREVETKNYDNTPF